MSRRGLIKAGVIGAGAGIAVFAMPSVAAASSVGEESLTGYYFTDSYAISVDWFAPGVSYPSPTPEGTPGPLLVNGQTITVNDGDSEPGELVVWGPGPGVGTFTGTPVGTFSWGDRDFSVTFLSFS
jgi:hypothetical protein